MSKSKEMFKECGYLLEDANDVYEIRYVRNEKEYGFKSISFDLTEKVYVATNITVGGWSTKTYIYTELHNAISQQIEELGWNK